MIQIPANCFICRVLLLTGTLLAGTLAAQPARMDDSIYREWINAMKTAERGPFARIRWFCKDGSVLPPQPYGCLDKGGGSQHGEWSEPARALRDAGYRIANIYSDLDIEGLMAQPLWRTELAQMLIEQFLIKTQDGWILHRARFYRGALQEEGERAGAQRLLLYLANPVMSNNSSFLQLRTAASLLPHGQDTPSAKSIRQLAAAIADADPGFIGLRNKIHIRPEAADVGQVMDYAAATRYPDLNTRLLELADQITALHTIDTAAILDKLAGRLDRADQALAQSLRLFLQQQDPDAAPPDRFRSITRLLKLLREIATAIQAPSLRLQAIDTGLLVEADGYAAASVLAPRLQQLSRRELLALLGDTIEALYGTGLLSRRQYRSLIDTLKHTLRDTPSIQDYRRALRYLGLAPEWGNQSMNFLYRNGLEKLTGIEPKSQLFIQDMLRGSLLFFYAQVSDTLVRDAETLAGIRNTLFGAAIGIGLRALNPGLAHGVLHVDRDQHEDYDSQGIYVLPETEADLPPVAGIITAGEGNPLSHVQLLARNLGIPNVTVAVTILDRLKPHDGQRVILAVSPGGVVRLELDPGAADAGADASDQSGPLRIHVNLKKLNLASRHFIDLGALRVGDSGVVVGPKAAKLGELKHFFPEAVADGVAIPFGVFRQLLEQESPARGVSMFDWIAGNYRMLATLPANSTELKAHTEQFRAALYHWVLSADPGGEFQDELRRRLADRFGAEGSYGLYVRSDTNVEDLPGFTGAGLNLTIPNVVGTDNLLRAVNQVWASPFTSRAYAWRQALMDLPEHVYPAVLLMQAVNVEKSGVLVTQDIDSGDRDWLSVAVNEGVGGAVDGQAAESLRIRLADGETRLLAQASSPGRRQLSPAGGIETLPAQGGDYILTRKEIKQLLSLARELPQRFPPVVDDQGNPAAADIEFGFSKGTLQLFQIRPFLENERIRNHQYLRSLDPDPERLRQQLVDLDGLATSEVKSEK
jgi:hypothetical protein